MEFDVSVFVCPSEKPGLGCPFSTEGSMGACQAFNGGESSPVPALMTPSAMQVDKRCSILR